MLSAGVAKPARDRYREAKTRSGLVSPAGGANRARPAKPDAKDENNDDDNSIDNKNINGMSIMMVISTTMVMSMAMASMPARSSL